MYSRKEAVREAKCEPCMDWNWSMMKKLPFPSITILLSYIYHSPFLFQLSKTELDPLPILPSLTHSCTFNLTMSNPYLPHTFPSNNSSSDPSVRLSHLSTSDELEQSVSSHCLDDLDGLNLNFEDYIDSSFWDSYTGPGTNEMGNFVDGNLVLSEYPTGNRSQANSNFEECLDYSFWDSSTAPGTNERGSFVDGNLGLSEYPTGNSNQLSGLEQLKVVEEPQEENYVQESENTLLKLGMVFSTEKKAKQFFDDYAGKNGFQVRMGDKWTLKNGSIKRNILCSRRKSLGKRRRGIAPSDCDAHFQITCEKVKWVVSQLNLEHTHELSPPNLCTEQADEATFIVESNISTKSRKRPNEVPFDKSKTKKHSGSLLGSQKAEEQKVNTPMDHSVGRLIETIEEADAIFADIDQVTSCVSSQATSSKKPNFSEETSSGAKMTLKKYLHMKLEDLVHPSRKPDVMNAVETLIHSNVLSEAQKSTMVELRSNLLIFPSLEEEMSKVQKSIDSRTFLIDYLKQAHLTYKNFRTLEGMKEMKILKVEALLKKMKASKGRLSWEREKLTREVAQKKAALAQSNSELPSLEERKKKAVDASKQASSSWEDNKKNFGDF